MPKFLLLDFETDGVDPKQARPLEYCFHFWDSDTRQEVQKEGFLWDEGYPEMSAEILTFHKGRITKEFLRRHGEKTHTVLDRFAQTAMQIDYFVAYNADFDRTVLESECHRQNISLPKLKWICAMNDIAYPAKWKCRKLAHLALDHGLPVDPSTLHGAKIDVELMLAILRQYDVKEVARLSESPRVAAKAQVSFQDKDLAKARGYSWEKVGNQIFPKTWVKIIRESQWDLEEREAPFPILRGALKE